MTLLQKKPLIEKLVDSLVIDEISISPSGTKIIYTVKSFGHSPGHRVSSLWVALTGDPGSYYQLTSGQHHDFFPRWSPDGRSLAFLSNRDVCESYHIYILEEPFPVSKSQPRKFGGTHNISEFYWSPNSKSIAFLSADEKHRAEDCAEKSRDDAEVFGDWKFTRPYLLNLKSCEIKRLYDKDVQTETLAWSPDASQLLLGIYKTPELGSTYQSGTQFEIIPIYKHSTTSLHFVSHFPGPILSKSLVWANDNRIFFTSGANPEFVNSSRAVYHLYQQRGAWAWSRYSHGEIDCVAELRSANGLVFGKVQSGLSDEIHILSVLNQAEGVIYSAEEEISAWDVRALAEGGYVLALAKSKTLDPQELFTVQLDSYIDDTNDIYSIVRANDIAVTINGNTDDNARETYSLTNIPLPVNSLTQISYHNQDLSNSLNLKIHSQVIRCKSQDNTTDLDALFIAPFESPSRKLPTCIFIHGGPYDRVTFSFNSNSSYMLWEALILSLSQPQTGDSPNTSHHFAILAPNYRGGSSRGESFAAHARGGVGTVDYDDVISLVDEGIKRGLLDPERIVVGGWSQGGILSYLLATRRNLEAKVDDWKIRGAICGAGATDLDMLALTSDHPYFEAELVGGWPWDSKRDNSIAENASAIKRFRAHGTSETVPSVLILHGQEDKRIPVGQAIGFQRACQACGVPCEMVTYPREPHLIRERAHLIDLLERVAKFCIMHLSN
ncbi:hypothetical protein B7463_g3372, partial [Scytalidium lignicola]